MTATDSSHDSPDVLSVKDVFSHQRYRVPLYQRAYAWTAAEINTLLADIRDARRDASVRTPHDESRSYYIGSLVVDTVDSDEGTVYEVVDGQQRLTTLYIILSLTNRDESDTDRSFIDALTFEGRDTAASDLRRLARHGSHAIGRLATDGIRHAAELVEQAVSRGREFEPTDAALIDGVVFSPDDAAYLRDHVRILRTELPPGTDLNHYFEVMNTRGEQLEKHEILKSKLLAELHPSEHDAFSWIWDACSVLDRHIQTQFSPSKKPDHELSERSRLFGSDWTELVPRTADQLFASVQEMRAEYSAADKSWLSVTTPDSPRVSLLDVLADNEHDVGATTISDVDPESGSYGSIIDFPNLLLHVLRIQRREAFIWEDPRDGTTSTVRLEDKHLLSEFDRDLRAARIAEDTVRSRVRQFAFLLLKTRCLLDTYVIRTQVTPAGDDDENWVLHRAFRYVSPKSGNAQLSARSTFRAEQSAEPDAPPTRDRVHRQVLMLQAMFQVSDTRRASKYFLFQILEWLHQLDTPWTMTGEDFVKKLEVMARSRLRALDFLSLTHDGTHTPNFLFNILDYELWRLAEVADSAELARLLPEQDLAAGLTKASSGFRFRYRTSVEHFYPVQPAAEQDHRQLDQEDSNSFGNLCLMSRSENSRRNNLMPIPKAREFKPTLQSLKFQLMSDLALRDHNWEEPQIRQHRSAMLRVLQNAADRTSTPGDSYRSAAR